MTEISNEAVSTRARRGRRPSTVQELFVSETEAPRERRDVVLRHISSSSDGFERTITCRSGGITVLPKVKQSNGIDVFRKALLGRDSAGEVSIRLGQHQLHISEIHCVLASDVIEPGRTVADALKIAGVPEETLRHVAAAVGLDKHLEMKTEAADQRVITRLTTAVAVWSRARIVYLDQPFKDVGAEWAPALAHFLLQSLDNSDRIIIVGGVEKLPRVWKSSPVVEIIGRDEELYDEGTQVIDESMNYLKKIQYLIGSNAADDGLLTTYPQRIFRRRTPSDAALSIEMITNPNLSDSEAALFATPPQVQPQVVRRRKRPSTGKLTRVTKLDKMRGSSVVQQLRSFLNRDSDVRSKEPALAQYRFKLFELRKKRERELQWFLLALLLLNLFVLALNLYYR